MPRSIVTRLAAAALLLVATRPAAAQPTQGIFAYTIFANSYLDLTGSAGPLRLAATVRGSYTASGATNGASDAGAYFAGFCSSQAPCFGGNVEFRNWFAFDLPTGTFTGATLRLQLPTGGYLSPNAQETFSVHDVSTPLAQLGTLASTAIFDDLGSGAFYGARVVTAADQGGYVAVTLNASALSAINASAGSSFTLGGTLFPSTTVPEPGTWTLLATGVVLLGGTVARRRRA